jgi:ribosomal protein S18 acetylase RimI-like enzyme
MDIDFVVRRASREDVNSIVDLTLRLKRLNEEFDPLYTIRPDAPEVVKKYIEESLDNEKVVMLVADHSGKIIGFLRAELRSRLFYEPHFEGLITDLYVLPAYRRMKIGAALIDKLIEILKSHGIYIVSAEFPPMNKIAVEFYENMGFKPLLYRFFKKVE